MPDLPAERKEPLFFESGASWRWLLAGPAAALAMLFVQWRAGLGFPLQVPMIFLVLVSGMLGLQVKAARIHTSVELTDQTLREGTEIVEVKDIVTVFPEPEIPIRVKSSISSWRIKPAEPREEWQRARALGELSGVPRGRTGVGLKLAGGRLVQAWARDHEEFRATLARLVESRTAR
ncbi:MAG: DUF3093 domain-containing protein [Mycobacterium sp.]|nr:DUF3093 domain-containing protein [Mycobacterium sp.]